MSKPEKSRALCAGCRDDFYNTAMPKGCWSFPKAKVVKRYAIGTFTLPTTPGAFTRVWTLDCKRCPGREVYSEKVPSFAVDVRDLTEPTEDPVHAA